MAVVAHDASSLGHCSRWVSFVQLYCRLFLPRLAWLRMVGISTACILALSIDLI